MKKLIFAMSMARLCQGSDGSGKSGRGDVGTDCAARNWNIRKIMHTLHMLTDRYGPRVTGTPNHEAAAKWAVAEMTAWGMKNGAPGAVGFRPRGLAERERRADTIVAPVREN